MIARCSIPRRMRDGSDNRTARRKHHRDASAPPARSFPGKSRESGISGGGDTRTATAERAKGEPSEGSPFCFGAENGTRTRAARERFRELWQIPPTPGRGALRSQVPSPSCTGIQKQKGESLKILPFALERKTELALALRASGSRILADTPGPWKGRFEVACAESLMHRHKRKREEPFGFFPPVLERKTGLGPATSTLARLRSTN